MNTREINEFIKNNYEVMTDEEIAAKVGISYFAVKNRRTRLGFYKTKNISKNIKMELSVLDQYTKTKSIKATMDNLKLPYKTVKEILDIYKKAGGPLYL